MAPIFTISYRTYPFGKDNRDPVIEDVVDAIEKEKLGKKIGALVNLTGLSYGAVANMVRGKTRYPRYSTVAAILGGLGYQSKFERTERFDFAAEMADAKRWNIRRKAAKIAAQERRLEQRRNARNTSRRDNNASLWGRRQLRG